MAARGAGESDRRFVETVTFVPTASFGEDVNTKLVSWQWKLVIHPVVRALQALRGMALVATATFGRRIRRYHPLRQSPPAHGVSRSGSVRPLQRRHTPPTRNHESREGRGAANFDRGGLELSVPSGASSSGPDQGRLHPGLERASGGRRGQGNHVAHGLTQSNARLSATCSPGRCRPGQPRT